MTTDKLMGFSITGMATDADNKMVFIGESTFDYESALKTLDYYINNFDNVDLKLSVKSL